MSKIWSIAILLFWSVLVWSAPHLVSLSPALTELVVQLGRQDLLVGRSTACDYPEAILKLPAVGDFAKPNLEKLLLLRPDLVIADDLVNPALKNTLQNLGVKVLLQPCRNLDDYVSWVKLLGRELDAPDAAQKELLRIAKFQREMAAKPPLPLSVLFIVWPDPLLLAGQNSLPDYVLRTAKVKNVAGAITPAYFKGSREFLLTRQIDVIICLTPHTDWQKRDFWRNLLAVQQNRVLDAASLPPDALQRPGPRLPDGIRILRQKLEQIKP